MKFTDLEFSFFFKIRLHYQWYYVLFFCVRSLLKRCCFALSYAVFASTLLQCLLVNLTPVKYIAFVKYDHCTIVFVCVFAYQDEVIGVSKKVVVRVEHLVKWTCPEPPQWKQNTTKLIGLHVPNGSSCTPDPQEVKTKGKLGDCC